MNKLLIPIILTTLFLAGCSKPTWNSFDMDDGEVTVWLPESMTPKYAGDGLKRGGRYSKLIAADKDNFGIIVTILIPPFIDGENIVKGKNFKSRLGCLEGKEMAKGSSNISGHTAEKILCDGDSFGVHEIYRVVRDDRVITVVIVNVTKDRSAADRILSELSINI